MTNNELTNNFAKIVLDLLKTNKSLRVIKLEDNAIDDKLIDKIIIALERTKTIRKKLRIPEYIHKIMKLKLNMIKYKGVNESLNNVDSEYKTIETVVESSIKLLENIKDNDTRIDDKFESTKNYFNQTLNSIDKQLLLIEDEYIKVEKRNIKKKKHLQCKINVVNDQINQISTCSKISCKI